MATTLRVPMIVAGRNVDSEKTLRISSPWDDTPVAVVAEASRIDIDTALNAAEHGLESTACLSRHARAVILHRLAQAVEARSDEFARTLVLEVGKPVRDARAEVTRTISTLEFAAEASRAHVGDMVPLDAMAEAEDRLGYTIPTPIGTVAAIPAVNFPLLIAAHKLAPALGAGCPVIVKPPDRAPLAILELCRLAIESGWPRSAISVLPGGPEVGQALVRDERVRLVSFTGSTAVGKAIAGLAGLKRLIMELGSNAATIVAEDADLDLVIERCTAGGFNVAGQSCISVQRVYVHESRYRELLDRLAPAVSSLVAGDPMNEETDVGPLIDDRAADRVETVIEDAINLGGELLIGGTRSGRAVDATVIAGLAPMMRLHREEVFGPVVGVAPYRELDEAIRLANDTPYGLQAGVFTNSLDKAALLARRLNVGGVNINDVSNWRADHMPYGGIKDSGLGKEGPVWAMREMTVMKMVTVRSTSIPERQTTQSYDNQMEGQ